MHPNQNDVDGATERSIFTMSKTQKNILAKIIRGVAIPPTFVVILTLCMYFLHPTMFRHAIDLIAVIIALALIPATAYVLAPILPGFKDKGRKGSRTLAFITSAIGYVSGMIYAFASGATHDLKFIFGGYMLALVMLLIFNKLFKLKASGHACGILGPLLYAVYFLGIGWLIPCLIVGAAVVWASIYRKSHTPKELMLGGLCACVGFFVGLI